MKTNRYKVLIPLDLTKNIRQAGLQAITEAEDKTRLYFMPAIWTAKLIKKTAFDYVFTVTRQHN